MTREGGPPHHAILRPFVYDVFIHRKNGIGGKSRFACIPNSRILKAGTFAGRTDRDACSKTGRREAINSFLWRSKRFCAWPTSCFLGCFTSRPSSKQPIQSINFFNRKRFSIKFVPRLADTANVAATFPFVVGCCLTFPEIVDATSIKMDFLPSGHVRTDPIISQTCLSDHIHTYYGPNLLPYPDITYDDLMATPVDQLTGNVEENKSLYWHPTVFRYDRAAQTYTRDEIGQSSAYCIWENMVPGDTRAFPENFRMIAGTNSNTATEFPNAMAECVNPSPCQREDCSTENDFFPSTACDELEVSMFFPGCWDGINVDSPDHKSHVAYSVDGDVGGDCPASHPVRIPVISFFFRIFNYDGGWHMFADESSTYQ